MFSTIDVSYFRAIKNGEHVTSKKIIKIDNPELLFGGDNIPERSYAVSVPDRSMEPLYQLGTVAIVDPDSPCQDGDIVHADISELSNSVVRQLKIEQRNGSFIKILRASNASGAFSDIEVREDTGITLIGPIWSEFVRRKR